jgi:predicted nucleic-acid-binding Zn-ribbon protein
MIRGKWSKCPKCGKDMFSENYIYTGNRYKYLKGDADSEFKIIGYRFFCRNKTADGSECVTSWDVKL